MGVRPETKRAAVNAEEQATGHALREGDLDQVCRYEGIVSLHVEARGVALCVLALSFAKVWRNGSPNAALFIQEWLASLEDLLNAVGCEEAFKDTDPIASECFAGTLNQILDSW